MSRKLSLSSRQELLSQTADHYGQVRGREKGQILDQLMATTGYSRKHAITVLNHPTVSPGPSVRRQAPLRRAGRTGAREPVESGPSDLCEAAGAVSP